MIDARALEDRLAAAYAVLPADGFEAADRRVAALTTGAAAPPSRHRWRGLRLALAVAAALVVLAGATVAAVRLIELVASATPGTSVALDLGVEFNERQVHGDYAITLERGYADINQVFIALSIEQADGRGPVGVDMFADLTDPAGVSLPPGGTPGFGIVGANGTAEVYSFGPATAAEGDYTLRVTTGRDGPAWTYRFRLPPPVGTVVDVAQVKDVAGTSIGVSEVWLSPTMARAWLDVDSPKHDVDDWWVAGYLRHDGQTMDFAWETRAPGQDADLIAGTVEGADPAEGEWTLVITELVGDQQDGTQVRLSGPWEFPFRVP